MAGELRNSVARLDPTVWAIRVRNRHVFRTRRLPGAVVEVERWNPAALTWQPAGTIPLSVWSSRFAADVAALGNAGRTPPAELAGIRNIDEGAG